MKPKRTRKNDVPAGQVVDVLVGDLHDWAEASQGLPVGAAVGREKGALLVPGGLWQAVRRNHHADIAATMRFLGSGSSATPLQWPFLSTAEKNETKSGRIATKSAVQTHFARIWWWKKRNR
jgi:hypothetical protein